MNFLSCHTRVLKFAIRENIASSRSQYKKILASRGNWEWLYCDLSWGIQWNIVCALGKSLGLCPRDFPWAQATFHHIPLLLSQYSFSFELPTVQCDKLLQPFFLSPCQLAGWPFVTMRQCLKQGKQWFGCPPTNVLQCGSVNSIILMSRVEGRNLESWTSGLNCGTCKLWQT